MGRAIFVLSVFGAAALGGCNGDPSVLSGSEISASASLGSISVLLLTPSTGCLAQTDATSYFLDGAPMMSGVCGAGSGQLLQDRSFVIEVRNHGDRAEMVVADMFPGMHAAVIEPAGGKVAPGGAVTVAVPPASRYAQPYLGHFVYADADDPQYAGTNYLFPLQSSSDAAVLVAPTHPGHFNLWVEMAADASAVESGRIASCTGVAGCSAHASADLGPLPIEVSP